MKIKYRLTLLFLIVFLNSYSQKNSDEIKIESTKATFLQFDVSTPLIANIDREEETDADSNNSWFLPDGISAKFGFGVQKNKWIGLSFHTGVDFKNSEKLVTVPVFGNFRISPKLNESDTRITLQLGYGKGFVLGRGNLVGQYKKISLGLESDDSILFFAEISGYKFKQFRTTSVYSFSLGIAILTF